MCFTLYFNVTVINVVKDNVREVNQNINRSVLIRFLMLTLSRPFIACRHFSLFIADDIFPRSPAV